MTHYNLMDPMDLAECGLESQDRLTRILGGSLQDHIEEMTALADAYNSAQHRIIDLETQVERLRATIAILENALAAKI